MLVVEAKPASSGRRCSKVSAYLESLADSNFWGSITLKYQNGQLIHVVQEQSLKPEELQPEYRNVNGSSKQ